MRDRENVLFVIATFNEIENLPELLERLWAYEPRADVLIVDDQSPDGTGQWCDGQAPREPRLHILHRRGQRGLGSAVVAGLRWGIAHGYELLGTMDADFSHPPKYIPELIRQMHADDEWADVVIGSRYCAGGKTVGWPWYRRQTSAILNAATRWLLALPARDSSGNYRLYRTCVLTPQILDEVHSEGYAYLEELLWLIDQSGAAISEIPIAFEQRRGGRSKLKWREPLGKLWVLGRLVFRSWPPAANR